MKSEVTYTSDIGLFTVNRSIKNSCDHRTSFCDTYCYNFKLYKVYKDMAKKDVRNDSYWEHLKQNPEALKPVFDAKKRDSARVRFMSRGEAFKDLTDVYAVREMLLADPDRLYWIPTRAWHSATLRAAIEGEIMPLKNAALNASLDPSDTDSDWESLEESGWIVMFFGDDSRTETPSGKRMFQCPKTHKKLKGHCAICKAGCFSVSQIDSQVSVHLSQH